MDTTGPVVGPAMHPVIISAFRSIFAVAAAAADLAGVASTPPSGRLVNFYNPIITARATERTDWTANVGIAVGSKFAVAPRQYLCVVFPDNIADLEFLDIPQNTLHGCTGTRKQRVLVPLRVTGIVTYGYRATITDNLICILH